MVVRMDMKHQKWTSRFLSYNLKELQAVRGSSRFAVVDENQKLRFMTRKEVLAYAKKVNGSRVSQRDGVTGIWSCQSDVKYAIKHGKLQATPKEAYELFAPTFDAVRKKIAEHAFAQTTVKGKNGKRVKAQIPIVPIIIAAPSVNTRSKEAELAVNFRILKKGWDPVAKKYRSIDFRKLMHCQVAAQAAGNQALGFALRDKGILVVPHGKSVTAVGYVSQPKGRAKMAAAGAGPGNVGPGAAAAAAQGIAAKQPKVVLPWYEAWENVKGVFTQVVTHKVSGILNGLSEAGQAHLATNAIKDAIGFYREFGAARFTDTSVKATAAQLCTPHVSPDVLDRVWADVTKEPAKLGLQEVKVHPTGHRVFSGLTQIADEKQAAAAIANLGSQKCKGLEPRQVLGTLVDKQLTPDQLRDVFEMSSGAGSVRWASQYSKGTLSNTITAYERNDRRVHVVGDAGVGQKLGKPTFSMFGFLDSATRTPHLTALWCGLREKGPFGDWLGAAEKIRAAPPRLVVKAGDLIVLAPPKGLKDAEAVKAVAEFAQKRGAKVVMAGQGAEQYRTLSQGIKAGVHH